MKKLLCVSLIALFFSAAPGHAQIVRRPLLNQFVRSPFVNQLVNLGVQQFLPGFPHIPIPPALRDNTAANAPSTLLVDSSVKGNLDRTASNLREADDILSKLLEANKASLEKKVEPTTAPQADQATLDPESATIADLAKQFANVKVEKDRALYQKKLLAALQKADKVSSDTRQYQDFMEKGRKALREEDYSAARTFFSGALKLNESDIDATNGLLLASSHLQNIELSKVLSALLQEISKVEVKIITKDVEVLKSGNSKIEIKLESPAPEKLEFSVTSKNLSPSSGTINAKENMGSVTVTTANITDATFEIFIEIAATKTTKAARATLKATVK